MIRYNLNYDMSGRRRKPKKVKGEVCGKYNPPKFKEWKPQTSLQQERAAEASRYPSCLATPTKAGGDKKESPKYTGDYVIGIATLHKSNAVPVTNQKYAAEISQMIK
jgi:hypothetical protein